ncbi:MAG: chromosome partitioning protein ParB [Desulfovibrio sp.]|nr:chromosome partitioning protein ParB [Desulfovibrio sp.]
MRHLAIHPRDADLGNDSLFWDAGPDEALVRSLDELGQMVPALVEIVDDRPRLLAGRRRALALRRLPGRTLASLVLKWPGPECGMSAPVWRGMVYLASNLGRAVSEAMLVQAGRYFLRHLPVADFLRLAGPYLGQALAAGSRRLTAWLDLPPRADALLFEGRVPLAGAPALAGMEERDFAALWPWLTAARWSANTLAAFVTPLREAARASGRPLSQVVRQALGGQAPGPDLSPNDLIAGLGVAARRTRYPVLTDLERRFEETARRIVRGTDFTLRPSRGFESDAVTLELKAGDAATLARAAAALSRMAADPGFEDLWSLARGEAEGDAGGDGHDR